MVLNTRNLTVWMFPGRCQMDERAGPGREVSERCQKSEDSGKSETRRWRRKRIYSVVWGS